MLSLYEELLLLSIHEDKGIFIGSTLERLKPGLVGAILAELALGAKISSTNNHRLHVADATPSKDSILDAALSALQKSDKERKFGFWLNNLYPNTEKLLKKVSKNLVQKGILTQEDSNLVWVIPSPLHPEENSSTKFVVIRHLRNIVLAKEQPSPREITLLSLLSACGLLDLVFLRDERKTANQYINELLVGEAMKDPQLETIQEIDSAITNVVEEE
jgi:Golgi phosphoprotein 3